MTAESDAPPSFAVLWDMDGTLVDTEPFWIHAEHELVAAHGGEWSDEHARHLVGNSLIDSAVYLQRVGGIDMDPITIVNVLLDRVRELMADDPPWRPGALELLADLQAQHIPCGLVTMSWRTFADAVVALLPSGTFAATVVGDEVANGKPHPEPYLTAARKLGVAPQRCVAIEDSPTGAMSASAAGCTVVGVPHVVDIPATAAQLIIPSLTQLDVSVLRSLVTA